MSHGDTLSTRRPQSKTGRGGTHAPSFVLAACPGCASTPHTPGGMCCTICVYTTYPKKDDPHTTRHHVLEHNFFPCSGATRVQQPARRVCKTTLVSHVKRGEPEVSPPLWGGELHAPSILPLGARGPGADMQTWDLKARVSTRSFPTMPPQSHHIVASWGQICGGTSGVPYVPPAPLYSPPYCQAGPPMGGGGLHHTMLGECLPGARPAHARHATSVSSILSLAPRLSSPWEVPQVDHTRPQTFSAKHVA